MASIGFEALDRQVIDGYGAELALKTDAAHFTFADLLEKVAALGGALTQLGVAPGDDVGVDLRTWHHAVIAVLACSRIGAFPGRIGAVQLTTQGDGSFAHAGDQTYEWRELLKAGALDTAPSLAEDAPGFAAKLEASYPNILDPLRAGQPITH